MASSRKSSSPDRPLYTCGQHGSYTATSIDRSSSSGENIENPILSSLPSMSRSTSTASQGDVTNFLHCLRFDPKSMAAEYKYTQHRDFKRLANAALGAPDDLPSGSLKGKRPSSSPDGLKRLKIGLRESTIKARERVKIFSEVLLVINKFFPSIPLRKGSRPDAFPSTHYNGLLMDRSVIGTIVGKMGTQSPALTGSFDYEQQKVEERRKNAILNKRTRTSTVDQRADVRPITPARSSGTVDRDREDLRLPNSNALQHQDRALPIVADGWEKAKMKKKRSVIKAGATPSPNSVSAKPIDGCREPKQGMHPRNLPDPRSKLNDSLGFRPGVPNGVVGAGKADSTSQQASMGIHSSIPRPEQDTSLLLDIRDNLEQERTNLRALNKASVREEFISGSSSSSTIVRAAARGPRAGSGVVPKLSPVVQRATASNVQELSCGTSKNSGALGSAHRKRTLSTQSSSPPVAQWADRRPQKMSRTARRTKLVPIVSSNDEHPALCTNDATGSEKGLGFARRFPVNSPKQFKSKGDHLPSSTLSESEESGATEIRSRDTGKKEEVEEKSGVNVKKMSTLVLPTRKNKFANEEDLVDGVRRRSRTGPAFASARSVMPMSAKKLGRMGTAKQLRTGRLGFEKSESKSGWPPTRKLSDARPYGRHKHSAINVAIDFLDDGQEELWAAANAVFNSSHALSSLFWRQMDPLFGLVSVADISYIKQEGSIRSTVNAINQIDNTLSNGMMTGEPPNSGRESRGSELSSDHLVPGTSPGEISLCQRLLAALISEEENRESSWCGNDDLKYDVYGSAFEIETDVESNAIDHWSLHDFKLGGHVSCGYKINFTSKSFDELMQIQSDNHVTPIPESAIATDLDHSFNGLLSDPAMMSSITCSESKYGRMSINERLILEIQSLGLYPACVPDLVHTEDEDVSIDIGRLEEKHHEQVSRKKSLLDKLLKSTEEARELHEKEFECLSLDKLTGMAYQKYLSCWGPSAPGSKSASGKMAKQAALDFVDRTLERCQEFEATGKSCFAEPLFRETFLSRSSRSNGAQVDTVTDGESWKLYRSSMENVSGAQLSPSLSNHDIYPSDALLSMNHSVEQTITKDDIWSSGVKKRELYLDDVPGASSGMPPGIGRAVLNSTKGKRSERDRVVKGNGREVFCRKGAPKFGRPASGNVKGERKTKAKLKQKTTQLSASIGGPLTKISDQHKMTSSSIPKSGARKRSTVKEKNQHKLLENSEKPLDFSHLQLPEMDDFGVGDDLGRQGQDIGSWLNIDDDVLQDDDFMGLEIPMDDLSDLNMMV